MFAIKIINDSKVYVLHLVQFMSIEMLLESVFVNKAITREVSHHIANLWIVHQGHHLITPEETAFQLAVQIKFLLMVFVFVDMVIIKITTMVCVFQTVHQARLI